MTFNLKCLTIGVNHLPLTPSIWLVVGGVSNYANSISRIPLQHLSSKVMLFGRGGGFLTPYIDRKRKYIVRTNFENNTNKTLLIKC